MSRVRIKIASLALFAAIAAVLALTAISTADVKVIRYVDADPDGNDTSGGWSADGDGCTIDGVDYEFCYDSIQDAIDHSNDAGATVLVGPGQYVENVTIDVEHLDVVSRDGAGATVIDGAGGTSVTIAADYVNLGIQPGTAYGGFTILGQTASSAGAGGAPAELPVAGVAIACTETVQPGVTPVGETIGVEQDTICVTQVGPNTVVIENNVLQGADAPYGIFVSGVIMGGHLIAQNNTFEKAPTAASFGFTYGIYFDNFLLPAPLYSLSLHSAEVELLNNTMTSIDNTGIYFTEDVYNSQVTISSSALSGTDGSFHGVYFDEDVRAFSTVDISGSKVQNFKTGIRTNRGVSNSSELNIVDNDINDFTTYGIEVKGQYTNSALLVDDNTLTADPLGAYRCIYSSAGPQDNSQATVSNNECSGFTLAGIDAGRAQHFSTLEIADNTLTAHSGGGTFGIDVDLVYNNSHAAIARNIVSGFTDSGLDVYDVYNRSTLTVDGNTFSGHTGDVPSYGMDMSTGTHNDGATSIINNTFTGYDVAGLKLSKVYDGGSAAVTGNTLTAHPDGSEYGIYVWEVSAQGYLEIDPNIVTGFTEAGLYVQNVSDDGEMIVDANVFTAHTSGAGYGVQIDAGVKRGSSAVFTNNELTGFTNGGFYLASGAAVDTGSDLTLDSNTFTAHPDGASYGLYAVGHVQFGSTGTITNNTFTGFDISGAFIDDVVHGSRLDINDNVFAPVADGACHGIFVVDSPDRGSTVEVKRNTISGIELCDTPGGSAGISVYEANSGSRLEICDNVITAHALVVDPGTGATLLSPGWDGIELNYPPLDGGVQTICNNTVSGFLNAQLHFNGIGGSGVTLTVDGNSFDGLGFGDYGVRFDGDLGDAFTGEITTNDIVGYGVDGISFGGDLWGKNLSIHGNNIIGAGANAAVNFEDDISNGSFVTVTENCMGNAGFGVLVADVLDTAALAVNVNDFSGAPGSVPVLRGIDASGVTNEVDGENNWWGSTDQPGTGGSVQVAGNVDYEKWLLDPNGAGCVPEPTATATATPSGTTTNTPTPVPPATPTWTPGGPATATNTLTPVPPTDVPNTTSTMIPTATAKPQTTTPPEPTATSSPQPTATQQPTAAPEPTNTPLPTATASPVPVASPPASIPELFGDANCDGFVDVVDAALILQLNTGLAASLACQDAGDVNGDGRVDSLDAALILQYAAGLIRSLPQ